jgi:PAS domain S-box-containing protein
VLAFADMTVVYWTPIHVARYIAGKQCFELYFRKFTMNVAERTKDDLIAELAGLRERIAELENDKVGLKLAEEHLRDSEERFRAIFLNLRDGLLLTDKETRRFLKGNPAIQEMLGYGEEEINRLGVADIHPELDLPLVVSQFEALAKGEIGIARDIPVRRKDGNVFYADISSSFPMVFNGRECLMGVFRDTTERRQAQMSLQESETRFRTLVERRPDAVTYLLALDENLPVPYISPQAEKIFGWAAQEYLENPGLWLRCIHPDDYERVSLHADRLLKTGEQFVSEYRIVGKNGQVVWVHDAADLMRNENGRPIALLGVAIDITGRKREEEQTLKLNFLKEELLAPDGLDRKLKSITDATVEIFGADFARIWITREGDLCDRGCLHAAVTEGPHICLDHTRCLHLVASSGRYTGTEGSHRRVPMGCYKIGRVAYGEDRSFIINDVTQDPLVHDREWAASLGLVAFAGFRLLSADLKPMGVLALFRKDAIQPQEEKLLQNLANTSSQVILAGMAEEELSRYRGRLEEIVRERTAELKRTNQQLIREIEERKEAEQALFKSQESLQESERELRNLTSLLFSIQEQERSRISKELHDGLGQELSVLKIHLNCVKKKLRDDQQPLIDECRFLLGYIDQSIENTRRLCKDLGPHLLEELGLAASIELMFKEVCEVNNLFYSVEMEPIDYSLPRRIGMAIYRIFQEALNNIVRHSGATKIFFSINTGAGKLNFLMQDNGIGFDIRSVNQQPPAGRGMGLFAMAERARMLGGSLVIESQKGAGTKIALSLPIREKEKR